MKILKEKTLKSTKGITLIALVITIIVLLILAGISISMLSGDNSILQKATDAKTSSERAEAKEQAQMDIMAYIADKTAKHQDASLDDEKIKEILSDNKSYVKVAGDTSFTTTKGEYEIPYSELYKTIAKVEDVEPVDPSAYGCKVTNYREGEDWEILYQGAVEEGGESRIYLIMSETTEVGGGSNCSNGQWISQRLANYSGSTDFQSEQLLLSKFPSVKQGLLYKVYGGDGSLHYESSYKNMKKTQLLLDSSIWNSSFSNPEFAEYAIATPTLELLVASYNAVNPNKSENIPSLGSGGYDDTDNFYTDNLLVNDGITPWNHGDGHGHGYILACPADEYDCGEPTYNRKVDGFDGSRSGTIATESWDYAVVRPVVCIKEGVHLVEQPGEGRSTYKLESISGN